MVKETTEDLMTDSFCPQQTRKGAKIETGPSADIDRAPGDLDPRTSNFEVHIIAIVTTLLCDV